MVNRIILTGRLGQDSEIKEGKNGKPYTRVNIATSSGYYDANKVWQETTYWHSVMINWKFDAAKADLVYIEGELIYYTDANKVKHAQIKATSAKVLSGNNVKKAPEKSVLSEEDAEELPF
jgi:single-strand DNA-binding protein